MLTCGNASPLLGPVHCLRITFAHTLSFFGKVVAHFLLVSWATSLGCDVFSSSYEACDTEVGLRKHPLVTDN